MNNMRVAFLTNILTPYRISFYDEVDRQLKISGGEVRVFTMTDSLPLRPWSFNELKRSYTYLLPGKKVFIGANDYLLNPSASKEIGLFSPDILIVAGSWTYPTFFLVAYSHRIRKNSKRLLWSESHNHTGINNQSKTNILVQYIKKTVFNKFDGFCVPGRYARETIGHLISLEGKRIVTLPNLVDSEFYNATKLLREGKERLRQSRNIRRERFVFVCPARFVDLKGIVPFLSNVANTEDIEKATFVFVGGGPEKDKIIDIAHQNSLDVRVYEYQTKEQVREWLALADAFLLPSLSDANPLSSIEAAWAGLPLCLSCYVGNAPELVDEGVNGVVFDTLSKESVSHQIAYVLKQSGEWYENAGRVSNWKARRDFEIQGKTRDFLSDLEKLCNSGKANE